MTTGMVATGVRGTVAEGFEGVRDEFAALVAGEGTELDAQVAAYHRGRAVVDLRSGPSTGPDSLLGIFSASKGVTHLLVAQLVDEGVLDLDRPVAYYWPEFAVAGKGDLLLRELLSHQAGVVGAHAGFTTEELADDRAVAARLAAQRPFWRPGGASGYHALVMGALSGEVIHRATGHGVPDLLRTRLATPLALDLHLGLPADQDHRFLPAQPMVATAERLRELAATAGAPDSLAGIAFNRHVPGALDVWELANQPVVRRQGPASLGGVGTARALAKLYAAQVSAVDGAEPLLSPDTVASFGQIQTTGVDLVLRAPKAWAVGFHSVSQIHPVLGAGAFGHSGAGGQQALVDPRRELSYAFLRRRFLFPTQADVDHGRMLTALVAATRNVA